MTRLPPLELNPELDIAELGAQFRRDGHVRVRRLFTRGAPELYDYLAGHEDWIQLVNHETGAHEVGWQDWRRPGARRRRELESEMFARATDEFQYCYAALFCHPCIPIKFLFDTEKIPAFRVIVNGFCPDARVNKRL